MPTGDSVPRETWVDWLPSEIPEIPDEDLITRDDLLRSLQERNIDISERTLRRWESLGYLPRPIRRWSNGSVRALYPPWADLSVSFVSLMLDPISRQVDNQRELSREHFQSLAHRYTVRQWFWTHERIETMLFEIARLFEERFGTRAAAVSVKLEDKNDRVLADAGFLLPVSDNVLPNPPET